MRQLTLLLLLVVANLIWGGSYVVMKLALEGLTPLEVSLWRMLPAGVLAIPLLAWYLPRYRLSGRTWLTLGMLALAAFVLNKFLEVLGVQLSTATNAALLLSLEPLFTIALGVVVLGEHFSRRRGVAFLLGGVGAYLLIARGFHWPEFSSAHVIGDLIFILGLTFEALYTVFGKSHVRRYPALLVTAGTLVLALGVWVPVGGVALALNGMPTFSTSALWALAFLSLGCSLLAYWAWFYALESMEAGVAAMTLFVQPVFGAGLAVYVLEEPVTQALITGAVLVLGALYLALAPPGLPVKLYRILRRNSGRLWRTPESFG